MAFVPLIKNVKTVANNTIPAELDSELKKVALSTFLFAILFGIGQIFLNIFMKTIKIILGIITVLVVFFANRFTCKRNKLFSTGFYKQTCRRSF